MMIRTSDNWGIRPGSVVWIKHGATDHRPIGREVWFRWRVEEIHSDRVRLRALQADRYDGSRETGGPPGFEIGDLYCLSADEFASWAWHKPGE